MRCPQQYLFGSGHFRESVCSEVPQLVHCTSVFSHILCLPHLIIKAFTKAKVKTPQPEEKLERVNSRIVTDVWLYF